MKQARLRYFFLGTLLLFCSHSKAERAPGGLFTSGTDAYFEFLERQGIIGKGIKIPADAPPPSGLADIMTPGSRGAQTRVGNLRSRVTCPLPADDDAPALIIRGDARPGTTGPGEATPSTLRHELMHVLGDRNGTSEPTNVDEECRVCEQQLAEQERAQTGKNGKSRVPPYSPQEEAQIRAYYESNKAKRDKRYGPPSSGSNLVQKDASPNCNSSCPPKKVAQAVKNAGQNIKKRVANGVKGVAPLVAVNAAASAVNAAANGGSTGDVAAATAEAVADTLNPVNLIPVGTLGSGDEPDRNGAPNYWYNNLTLSYCENLLQAANTNGGNVFSDPTAYQQADTAISQLYYCAQKFPGHGFDAFGGTPPTGPVDTACPYPN